MKKSPDLLIVAGARPNFMKIAPIWRAVRDRGRLSQLVLHTGQHHDFEMSRVFFEDLELPEPEIFLGPSSGTHAEQTGKIMRGLEEVLGSVRPRLLVVVGDVNSTMACSVVAAKAQLPIAHVEAGLRSFDRSMPEEINRLVTDALSEILFTTCADGVRNLRQEGVSEDRICQVGNVMIDSLQRYLARAQEVEGVVPNGLENYALVTLHRPSNVDSESALRDIVEILEAVARIIPVIFPVHPRTLGRLREFKLAARLGESDVELLEPQSYLRFLHLLDGATVVLTDSGGVQEETTVLGVPCLTMRPNTERPVTIDLGTNVLVERRRDQIVELSERALNGEWKPHSIPEGWDGKAALRIEEQLARWLQSS